MTKPCTSSTCSQHQHPHLNFSLLMEETEFKVAEILLQLPQLVFKLESLHRFSFCSWGRKRRRSSMVQTPSLPPVASTSIPEIEKKPKALSPATPLLFSAGESDEKSKHSKRKVSLKRKKEDWLGKIKELTERKENLKEVIKNLQHHYHELKLLNLTLKAKKRMLILGLPKEESESQPNFNHADMSDIQQSCYLVHHTNACEERVVSSGVCLFDLNLLPEECCGGGIEAVNVRGVVDKSEMKALAAQARHRRIQICRSKNPNLRLRYPIL